MATKVRPIDVRAMDEQLKHHLEKLLSAGGGSSSLPKMTRHDVPPRFMTENGRRPEAEEGKPRGERHPPLPADGWELDPKKLRVKSVIGQGSYGYVYRGTYDGRDVAVKVLEWDDEKKKREIERDFIQEVSVWYQLDHPNIAKLIGALRSLSQVKIKSKHGIRLPKTGFCIVVEYLPRGTLQSYLYRNRSSEKRPLSVALQFAIDVAKGLSYLHSKKIVHRDVKTTNLLLDKSGRVKFVDFGVSRLEAANRNEMTATTGTVGYMAPEVFDKRAYDHKCDIYSFGICLWEIYHYMFPFPDYNPKHPYPASVYKILRPEIAVSCPSALANVMTMCWDVNSRKRPEMETVVEMLEAVRAYDDASAKQRLKKINSVAGFFCLQPRAKASPEVAAA
ncbi:hypothetical protein DM860_013656 [Cuscuta australis]|uniref:Protein kinase domain-containing protein n=1 Tax=Cuscuta australis TaxID=267555 RepID=A0A328EB95_9ASTE|nr:hypothetical protein DM860_013656 [Cuscuta australis]